MGARCYDRELLFPAREIAPKSPFVFDSVWKYNVALPHTNKASELP